MDGSRDDHTKWSKRQVQYEITCMWNLKYDTNQHETKTDSETQRTDLWLSRGREGRIRKEWKFGISRGTLLSVQFSSVTQSCPTLSDPVDCSTPGFPVHHQLLELAQTCVLWVSDAIQPSHPQSSPSSSRLQSFPASGPFPKSQFFASGGQSIGVSASVPVLPMNIQD